jgi:hypothetical protein
MPGLDPGIHAVSPRRDEAPTEWIAMTKETIPEHPSEHRHSGASRNPEAAGREFAILDTGLRRYDAQA